MKKLLTMLLIGVLLSCTTDLTPTSDISDNDNFLKGTIKTSEGANVNNAVIVLYSSTAPLAKTMKSESFDVIIDSVVSVDGTFEFDIKIEGYYSLKAFVNDSVVAFKDHFEFVHRVEVDLIQNNVVKYSNDYLPLSIGNSWIIETENKMYIDTILVSGDTLWNDKDYFITSYGFMRVDDDRNIEIIETYDTTSYTLDFSATNDTKYNTKNGSIYVTKPDSIITPYGTFYDCIQFYIDKHEGMADEEITYVFAKGIGLIRIYWQIGIFNLKSMNIK